jgi:hypothetical protein
MAVNDRSNLQYNKSRKRMMPTKLQTQQQRA